MDSKVLVFNQFEYCNICKLNDNVGKKHVYSKKHRDILESIIVKTEKKVKAVKELIKRPDFHPYGWENSFTFWCYICDREYKKHISLDSITISSGGFIEHFSSLDHKTNMIQYWKKHRIDKTRMANIIISEEEIATFKKMSLKVMKQHNQSCVKAVKGEAAKLRKKGMANHSPGYSDDGSQTFVSIGTRTETARLCSDMRSDNGYKTIIKPSYIELPGDNKATCTIAASGEGLACIGVWNQDDAGNIHSGATPPWFNTTSVTNQDGKIGPTLEDYNQHLCNESKRKLPATRVGVSFDHTIGQSGDNWLPSFGSVWNKGRRVHNKEKYFETSGKTVKTKRNKQKSSEEKHYPRVPYSNYMNQTHQDQK